ncbi:glutathione S-transferase family protein [Phenylobacterium immobile]|uniref:glutathione S-transferase family protein n=1 Tax=Phenylobacterium immobile TaxID=21 RepID=UPI000AE9DEEE|nr:glutathione S-transferase family protein [Phenylobacterium immobile]
MILIGQFDSPFVRRVGVAMQVYGLAYEHRPWSTFGDADLIRPYNPLTRVPTLVLDGGEVLIESFAILDWLDELAGPDKALIDAAGDGRRQTLRRSALATGLCDKMVSLIYERALHDVTSEAWLNRCETQVGAAMDALERERAGAALPYWSGDRLTHADISLACAVRFLGEAHPTIFALARWPNLVAHGERCEALAAFQAVKQVFIPPA